MKDPCTCNFVGGGGPWHIKGCPVNDLIPTYQPNPPMPAEVALLLEDYAAVGEALHEVRNVVNRWADSDGELADGAAALIGELLVVLHRAGYR